MPDKALTIAILATGSEGGGVLADWIVDLAGHGGYRAQAAPVPGSATYYIEIVPEEAGRAAGQEVVPALIPVPGEPDVVIASDLMEASRAVERGMVTPDRTSLIASTHRVYSMTDSAVLLEAGRAAARQFVRGDFAAIAQSTGSVIGAVLFGALAASGVLPFTRGQFEDAIRRGGIGVESSLCAFRGGACFSLSSPPGANPPDCDTILQAGIERLTDFQDAHYAEEYVRRLAPIRGITLLSETARSLALWMSYEDAIRLADVKIRADRFARIHQKARTAPGQMLKIHEYVYPCAGEIADILPAGLGRWLPANGPARKDKILQTTSLRGFLKLRLLAAMRRWRRKSVRFQREQQEIDKWLTAVVAAAERNYALACEVAQAPRLIEGYGATHANGMRAYHAAMEALPELLPLEDAAARFRKLVIIGV